MRRTALMFVLAGLVGALVAVPIAVYASHSFSDVSDSNTFHSDIAWLADAGVTKGCNPPANDEFCPKDQVTREQMAAFMRRLAENQVVDAATVQGLGPDELMGGGSPEMYYATVNQDGDLLAGNASTAFLASFSIYEVGFPRSTEGCVATATAARIDDVAWTATYTVATGTEYSDNPNRVTVHSFFDDGPISSSFHLIMMCP